MFRLNVVFAATVMILSSCCKESTKIEKPGRIEALILYYSQTEGEGAYVAIEQLYQELIQHPQEWYEAMSKDSISFNRFYSKLEHFVFNVGTSQFTAEDLESIRKQGLGRLKKANISKEFQTMHAKMIEKLEAIKIE